MRSSRLHSMQKISRFKGTQEEIVPWPDGKRTPMLAATIFHSEGGLSLTLGRTWRANARPDLLQAKFSSIPVVFARKYQITGNLAGLIYLGLGTGSILGVMIFSVVKNRAI
jgi:hypothetical protein